MKGERKEKCAWELYLVWTEESAISMEILACNVLVFNDGVQRWLLAQLRAAPR